MKTLILVRHAKSSWDDPSMSDFDRPLNERGKNDAPEMAKRLKDRINKIDLFVSSTAKRARRTARFFAEEYGKKKDDILLLQNLYLASAPAFLNCIMDLDDKHATVVMFAHNPGITEDRKSTRLN